MSLRGQLLLGLSPLLLTLLAVVILGSKVTSELGLSSQRIVNEKAETPFAQRNFLNTLRAMFRWALKEGRIPDDPTLGIARQKVKTAGYKTWSEDHIARFEARHPIGTKARLAFASCSIPARAVATS